MNAWWTLDFEVCVTFKHYIISGYAKWASTEVMTIVYYQIYVPDHSSF